MFSRYVKIDAPIILNKKNVVPSINLQQLGALKNVKLQFSGNRQLKITMESTYHMSSTQNPCDIPLYGVGQFGILIMAYFNPY